MALNRSKTRTSPEATMNVMGPTGGFLQATSTSEAGLDLTSYANQWVYVQVITENADIVFAAAASNTLDVSTTATTFSHAVGERLYAGMPATPMLVPLDRPFLRHKALGTGQIRVFPR